jgi:hypothetical protein
MLAILDNSNAAAAKRRVRSTTFVDDLPQACEPRDGSSYVLAWRLSNNTAHWHYIAQNSGGGPQSRLSICDRWLGRRGQITKDATQVSSLMAFLRFLGRFRRRSLIADFFCKQVGGRTHFVAARRSDVLLPLNGRALESGMHMSAPGHRSRCNSRQSIKNEEISKFSNFFRKLLAE